MTLTTTDGKRKQWLRGPHRAAILTLVSVASFFGFSADLAEALDLSTEGWVRYRYFFVDNAPIVPIEGKETQSDWLDQRITLSPSLKVNDWAFVQARLDLLDGVVFGRRSRDAGFLVELSDATDDVNRFGEKVQAIDLRRAYLEVKPPYGMLRIGRQGNQWGLGILANSGDDLEWGLQGNGPERGDTVDRVAFLTDIGRPLRWREDHLIVEIAYDRPVDPDLSTTEDAVNAFVGSILFTNGTVSPRVMGTREAGVYATYMTQDSTDLGAAVVDGYAHLGLGPFYLQGEAVFLFGSAGREALVRSPLFDKTEEALVEAAVPVLEAAGVPDARGIAQAAVAHGSPQPVLGEVLVPAYEQALQAGGYSLAKAVEVAGEVDARGLDAMRGDEVDLGGYGFLTRGGMRTDWFHAGAELALASGQDAGNDVEPVLVGPLWAPAGVGLDAARREEMGRLSGAALTGDRFRGFALDSEFDPNLILFKEVGPMNLVTGRPAITDAWYGRAFGEIFLDSRTTFWISILYAQLLEKSRPFEVKVPLKCSTCPPEIKLEPPENRLGAEMDVGIVREIVPNVRAELKFGYLLTGAAFGEDAEDVWMIRPQIACEF